MRSSTQISRKLTSLYQQITFLYYTLFGSLDRFLDCKIRKSVTSDHIAIIRPQVLRDLNRLFYFHLHKTLSVIIYIISISDIQDNLESKKYLQHKIFIYVIKITSQILKKKHVHIKRNFAEITQFSRKKIFYKLCLHALTNISKVTKYINGKTMQQFTK